MNTVEQGLRRYDASAADVPIHIVVSENSVSVVMLDATRNAYDRVDFLIYLLIYFQKQHCWYMSTSYLLGEISHLNLQTRCFSLVDG